jgi:ribonuclease BN (tRNA processing enzyme)
MKLSRLMAPLATGAIFVGSAGWLLSQRNAAASTTAIVLGVGSPVITAERSGTSIGVIVAGTMYVFDAGDGVVRRIMEAAPKLAALHVERLGPVFLTHLDPDHTLGLAGLLYYHNFYGGRLVGTGDTGVPLTIYGPGPVKPPAADREGIGVSGVVDHLRGAFAQTPFAPGIVGSNLRFSAVVQTTEIEPGVVYQDSHVTVTAFKVDHKAAISFGFRIQTADRLIVISGDTRPVDAVIDACKGCDLLFHEVFGMDFGAAGPSARCRDTGEAFFCNGQGHTSARELGELAQRARPKQLVVYHSVQISSEKAFLETIGKAFSGKVTLARDLDIF